MKAMQNILVVVAMMSGSVALAQGALTCPAGTKVSTMNDKDVIFQNCVSTTSGMCEGAFVGTWRTGGNHTVGQCKDGMRTGHWLYFDQQGKKTAEIDFLAGNYHGVRVEYHANGQKRFEENYVNGRMTAQKNFDQKGAVITAVSGSGITTKK